MLASIPGSSYLAFYSISQMEINLKENMKYQDQSDIREDSNLKTKFWIIDVKTAEYLKTVYIYKYCNGKPGRIEQTFRIFRVALLRFSVQHYLCFVPKKMCASAIYIFLIQENFENLLNFFLDSRSSFSFDFRRKRSSVLDQTLGGNRVLL